MTEIQKKQSKRITAEGAFLLALLFLALLAGLKTVFVGIQKDEEYAYSMAYRLICSDRLLLQVWDPHQTSAFLLSGLEWLFIKITGGTTYIVLFCRLATLALHIGISVYLFDTFKRITTKYSAALCAVLFYIIVPKEFMTAEFSLMMSWFMALFVISLLRATIFTKEGKNGRAIADILLCGVWICGLVLSYPSCILVAPVALIGIFVFRKKLPKFSVLYFLLPIILIGGGYIAYLLSYMTSSVIMERVRDVLDACGSHEFNMPGKALYNGKHFLLMIGLSAGTFALSWLGSLIVLKARGTKKLPGFANTILISAILGAIARIVIIFLPYFDTHVTNSYDYFFFFLILFGGIVVLICSRKNLNENEKIMSFGLIFSFVGYVAVLLLTNLTVFTSIRYVTPAFAICLYFLLRRGVESAEAAEKEALHNVPGEPKKAGTNKTAFPALILVLLLSFTNLVYYMSNNGYIWNISKIGTIVKSGAGKGILTEYMVGYIENKVNEDWAELIHDGDVVLIWDESSLYYLNKDVKVGSYTTISTPTYTVESIKKFWKNNPDSFPNVIAVSCWFGEIHIEGDYSEFYNWIENEYGADEVIDRDYYRYFIRKSRVD